MKKFISLSLMAILCLPTLATAKYFAQTNHFALKEGQDWTWANLAKTPKIKWENKTPKSYDGHYYMTGSLGKYGTIHVDSLNKNKPTSINIMITYHETERNSDKIYKLTDYFNKAELKEIKSNCTKKQGEMRGAEYQHFYQWNKKGYKPLYVGVRKFLASDGHIDHNHIIVQDFNQFNNLLDAAIDRYDENDNEITCRIL